MVTNQVASDRLLVVLSGAMSMSAANTHCLPRRFICMLKRYAGLYS